jgi:hypothetical protein
MSISINSQSIGNYYNSAVNSRKEKTAESFSVAQNNIKYLYPSNKLLLINSNISFGSSEKTSPKKEPSQATMDYIAKRREELNGKLVRLDQLDLDKISDICAGIPVFEHLTAKQLYIITNNLDDIMLQSGCPSQCSHCMYDADKKAATMSWDNFTDLVDGFAVLKDRLGFVPINKQSLYPFMDSEPMNYISKDKDGKYHNIFDAAKYFYEKTGKKFYITTSGWETGIEGHKSIAQQAAESFAEHPEYLKTFAISVHPFHRYIENYKKLLKDGKETEAEEERNRYIERMANVIKTTIDFFDTSKIISKRLEKGILLEYLYNNHNSQQESYQLLEDVMNRLKEQNIDVDKIFEFDKRHPLLTTYLAYRAIRRSGRTEPKREITADEIINWSDKIIGLDGYIYTDNPFSKEYKLPYKLNFRHPNKGELNDKYKNAIEVREKDII